jgi:hypothetical protein
MLRLGRLPEAWIAPPAVRERRELVRYRAKLVALRSGLKAQVHAVMAKEGVLPAAADLFCMAGNAQLDGPRPRRRETVRTRPDASPAQSRVQALAVSAAPRLGLGWCVASWSWLTEGRQRFGCRGIPSPTVLASMVRSGHDQTGFKQLVDRAAGCAGHADHTHAWRRRSPERRGATAVARLGLSRRRGGAAGCGASTAPGSLPAYGEIVAPLRSGLRRRQAWVDRQRSGAEQSIGG